MSAEVQVQCVLCKHREWTTLGSDAPLCVKCFSPCVVIAARATPPAVAASRNEGEQR